MQARYAALHDACDRGDHPAVLRLLDGGLKADWRVDMSLLHMAAAKGHSEVSCLLFAFLSR